jgi:hypothetical protein
MGRLGVVKVPDGAWRKYAGPVVALVAVTVTVALVRTGLHGDQHPRASAAAPVHRAPARPAPRPRRRVYVVRAGDTIEAISGRTGIPQGRLLALNPTISPTALFIGERLRLS